MQMTNTEKILLAIESTDGYPFTRKEICQALPEVPVGTVSSIFTKLKASAKIMAVGVGEYRLINPRKELEVPQAEPAETSDVSVADLSDSEMEDVLTWIVQDYIRLRRDYADLRSRLQRLYGEAVKGKVIPNHLRKE